MSFLGGRGLIITHRFGNALVEPRGEEFKGMKKKNDLSTIDEILCSTSSSYTDQGGTNAARTKQEGFIHSIFQKSSKHQENSYPSP